MVDVALSHGMQAALDHAATSPPDAESYGAALVAAMHDLTAVESVARCLESARETLPEPTLATAIDAPSIVESTVKVAAPSVVWTSWDAPMYDSVANLLSFVAWFSLPIASVPQVARAAPAMPALSLPPTARDEPDEWDHDRDMATSRLAGNLVRSWLHAAVYEPQSAIASSVVDDCMPLDTSSHAGICDAGPWDVIAVLSPPVTSTDTWAEAATTIAAQNVRVRLTDAALSAATTTMATTTPDTVTSSELAINVSKAKASDAGISERYLDDVASLAATVAQSCIDAACHVICAKALYSTASNDEPEPEACESTACMDAKVELTKMMRPTALVATRAVDAWMHAALMTSSAAIRTDKSSYVLKTTSKVGTDMTPTTSCVADVNGLASVARQYARAATSDAIAVLAAGLSSPSVSIDIKAIDVAPTATLVSAIGVASATRDDPDLTLCESGLDSCLRDMATQLVQAWTEAAVRAMIEQHESTAEALETPDPPCLDDCQPIDAVPLMEEEEDSMCSQVAASILAGHLVRAWIADTIAEVAWFTSRPHEHDAAVASLTNATPSSLLEKATALASAPETIDASEMAAHDNEVAVTFLAGRLVRAWLYETCGVIAERALACTAASLAPLDVCDNSDSVVVLPAELSEAETTKDDIVDVAASVLAGQLVRAWLYETMNEVVQFSARRHEHAADASACTVTEAPASPVVVDDPPPTLSMAPVIIDGAELETSDDSMVTVSILAGQLANAWVYETMDNILTQRSAEQNELKTNKSQSELQPSRAMDEELSPSSENTSAVEPLADDISDASLVVAVSILAGQLVRMWVYDVMDSIVQRSTQQLASALNVVDDAPLVAIDLVSADDKASDEPRDDTVAASILAGRLVRAWTYDVIKEIAQLTARRHEHATSCADAETVISAIVITESKTADAETVDTETADAVDATHERVAATTDTAGLPSTNVQLIPPEEVEILEPSACELAESNRAVAASMLSGQLVRGWLHEASLSCVTQLLVTDASAALPSLTDHVAALTAPWTQPTHGLYVEVAEHFEAASWRPVPAFTTSAGHSPAAVEVPSMSELQRLPMDVVAPLPASELPDLVETMPKVPLWRVNTELSLSIDDAITASRIAGQLVRVWLHDAVSSVAATTCKPSRSILLVEGASVVSPNENTTRLPARPDTSKQVSSSAVDPTLCALLSRHLLSTWLTDAMERTAAKSVCVQKEIPAAYDQAQADPPPDVLSVALPASVPVPPAPPVLVVTSHTALVTIEQAVATTLVHQWLVGAVAKAVDDAALESSDSETATSYVSSSDSRSSLSSYSSESTSSYGSSSLSSSKASSVSDLHASSASSLSPLDEAS
ncbi:hypothetical protein SPRG_17031 [Saprolegnia parasitica CBS 223.65]|uniref:Uncharacterized protein n=1 Tax=Saprolegnia parasitica (strain CBS 223.65) TaxID=695850 RepID=A0A067BSD2_SAPPC|nr:hypothetical protein SPRG_17031 [Saprolegnia parasitica CBS 223.65]KDO17582.1 hypothetical protein SPRG_17031 [Saprolegnia parasitica CBS 223.65]|eukprot:XP_012211708.1 hypothetical protein SPRG_17031 [Saprolegnia parasitica CBS 223.65]